MILGSPGANIANVRRKVAFSPKAVILDKKPRIFAVIFWETEVTSVGTWKLICKFLCE